LRDKKTGARRWYCDEEPTSDVLDRSVESVGSFDPARVDLVFTAIESDGAREIEPAIARRRR